VKVGVLVLLAVFDSKVGIFDRPFLVRSSAEGIRSFADEVARQDSVLRQHPEDYSLHRMGEFDQTTGAVIPEVAPVALITALELVARDGLKAVN